MRLLLTLAASVLTLAPTALADLTVDQKVADFQQLAAVYAKNYGPYELKLNLYGFDLLNTQPWLDQVKASKTDIDFYDICVRYVASLQDSHDEFTIRSTFDAWLHFDGDLYDGKFIIDYIDRSYLPSSKYPFRIGDELVSVDGMAVADLITSFAPYAVNGSSNPVSRKRIGAGIVTERYQGWYPRANNIGDTAAIVVNRQATGTQDAYTITWGVFGDAVTTAGLIPSPHVKQPAQPKSSASHRSRFKRRGTELGERDWNAWGATFSEPGPDMAPDEAVPSYLATLASLQFMGAAEGPINSPKGSGISPFGSVFPVFDPPAGFKVRLGLRNTDEFLSGTFPSGSKTIGFIRIPSMSPSNTASALSQFSGEIQYFQGNVDGLVIDVMANGGGSVCYTEQLVSMLIPGTFTRTLEELRATLQWQVSFASAVERATINNAPGWVVADYQYMLDAVKAALKDNRARTGGLPLCSYKEESDPYFDSKGVLTLYTKPLVVVTDNFTLSAGELFTMFLQDNGRATIIGTTTDGGGGNVVSYSATSYSEGLTRMTQGIIRRTMPFSVPGFPAMSYYDGVGIYPDIWQDYMTVSNLNSGGVDFVAAVVSAITNLIP